MMALFNTGSVIRQAPKTRLPHADQHNRMRQNASDSGVAFFSDLRGGKPVMDIIIRHHEYIIQDMILFIIKIIIRDMIFYKSAVNNSWSVK